MRLAAEKLVRHFKALGFTNGRQPSVVARPTWPERLAVLVPILVVSKAMNELEFKRHLKALAHGHHHPEEHDWDPHAPRPRKAAATKTPSPKSRVARKSTKRK
jgi:hypothetical protein